MDPYQSPEEPDFDNPYAPPRSSFQPEEQVDRQGVSIPFTVDSIVNTSWSIFKAQLGTFLWVVWAPLGVNIGLGIALTIVNAALLAAMPGDRMTAMAIYWVLYVLSLLIQTWLGIGMTLGLFKVVRGEPVAFDVLFSGGRYILRVVLGFILLFLIFMVILLVPLFLIGAASAMLANNAVAGIVFMVITVAFCVVVMLYMSARLAQFYYLILDRDAGAFQSIQLSWQLTSGRAGTIILIYLLQMMLAVAGFLALCVGLIFTTPLSYVLLIVTYLALIGKEKPPARAQLTTWDDPV